MSTLDNILVEKYKKMAGLDNIYNLSNNSILKGGATISSNLYISGFSILQNSVTNLTSLNVNGPIILNNATMLSSLYVSGNAIFNNNVAVNGNLIGKNYTVENLLVSSNTVLNNRTTILSTLDILGNAKFEDIINTNNIQGLNNNINIVSPIINIGNNNSKIYIYGTATFVATTDLKISDKLISLNLNANNADPADIGLLSGIEILSISGQSFIKTNSDATRFLIKAPLETNTNYIATLDYNNNLNVSGSTIITDKVTMLSNLNISGSATLYNSVSLLSSLIVPQYTNLIGTTTMLSKLNVSGVSLLMGSNTILSNFNVSGITTFNGDTTILSTLNINDVCTLNNVTILSSLNVSNNTILNGVTSVLSNLNVTGTNIFQGNVTSISSLNISGFGLLCGSSTIYSSLNILGNTVMNNSVTINSNLNISGNTIINSSITIGSILSYININGQIVCPLPEYLTNNEAASNNVSNWGIYRTGGIVKIKLDIIPPEITLSGGTSVSISVGSNYIDPGSTAIDNTDGVVPLYLSSILTGTTNLLPNQILISGTTTITQTSTLGIGTYNLVYVSVDSVGNVGTKIRILNII